MFSLPHWMYALAVFYGAIGVVIFRLARRPTCRLCLYRSDCPNRVDGLAHLVHEPKCVAAEKSKLLSLSFHSELGAAFAGDVEGLSPQSARRRGREVR